MKRENKCKRKGIKVLPALGEKNLAKRMEENNKKMDWSLDRVVWKEKKLKTFEKVSLNTWRTVFKKFSTRFSIDRNKQRLTNIFNCNFDQSKNNFDRLKFWKNQFFEKQSKIIQKLLKALKFMNYMHEYEMKWFSKTHILNLVFPKLRFSIHSLKISTIKYVLHKTQGIFKLGWSNQKYT